MPQLAPHERMARAKLRVAANLPALAAEILEMRNTAILPNGLVREFARELDIDRPLSLIESMVCHAALEAVAAR